MPPERRTSMCSTLLASILISAASCPPQLNSSPAIPAAGAAASPAKQAARLSDPQLQQIRGGRGFATRTGREGVQRLVQDTSLRQFAMLQQTTPQQMDNWWLDIGSGLIAASIFN